MNNAKANMTVLKHSRILHYGQADSTSIVFTAGRRQDTQTLLLVHTVLLTVIHFCDSFHISFCCTCKSLHNFVFTVRNLACS